MEKNWLIRTKSNHILGPVSKEKVIELYQNGSIKPDDEICSANGYWFFIREKDLVDKFLIGNDCQGFNPISEAKDVLTLASDKVPSERTRDDITVVSNLNQIRAELSKDDASQINPGSAPKETEAVSIYPDRQPEKVEAVETKKKIKNRSTVSQISPVPQKNNFKKHGYLKFIGLIGFIILFCLIYFRKTIIKSIFHGEISQVSAFFIPEVHAQDLVSEKKNS